MISSDISVYTESPFWSRLLKYFEIKEHLPQGYGQGQKVISREAVHKGWAGLALCHTHTCHCPAAGSGRQVPPHFLCSPLLGDRDPQCATGTEPSLSKDFFHLWFRDAAKGQSGHFWWDDSAGLSSSERFIRGEIPLPGPLVAECKQHKHKRQIHPYTTIVRCISLPTQSMCHMNCFCMNWKSPSLHLIYMYLRGGRVG